MLPLGSKVSLSVSTYLDIHAEWFLYIYPSVHLYTADRWAETEWRKWTDAPAVLYVFVFNNCLDCHTTTTSTLCIFHEWNYGLLSFVDVYRCLLRVSVDRSLREFNFELFNIFGLLRNMQFVCIYLVYTYLFILNCACNCGFPRTFYKCLTRFSHMYHWCMTFILRMNCI